MLKADNGKFLYNHRTKNVITASRDEVNERCKFSLQVMYLTLIDIPTVYKLQKSANFKKIILEAQNQAQQYILV